MASSFCEDILTIICPIYNGEQYLQDTLSSLKNQKFKKWNLLAINDGSTDSTPEILHRAELSDTRIKAIHLEQNQGVSNARNLGLQNTQSKYVSFMDADDVYLGSNVLQDLIYTIENPNFDNHGVFCKTVICDQDYAPLGVELRGQPLLDFRHILTSPIHINSAIFTKNLISKISFNTSIKNGEDWLFLSQVLRSGVRLEYVNTDGISYRWHEKSSTHKDFLLHENSLKNIIRTFLAEDEAVADTIPEWKNGLKDTKFDDVWINRRCSLLIYLLLENRFSQANEVAYEIASFDVGCKHNMHNLDSIRYPAVRHYRQPWHSALANTLDHYIKNQQKWDKALNLAGLSILRDEMGKKARSIRVEDATGRADRNRLKEKRAAKNVTPISLILCTHNGEDNLPWVLESLLNQRGIPVEKFEIVIVLNGCTDNSEIIAQDTLKNSPFTYKIVHESKLGLSHARNRGIEESSFEHIAYVDDDTFLDHNWAIAISDAFYQTDCDVIGGKVSLWFRDIQEPEWLDRYHKRMLGYNDFGPDRLFDKTEYVFGCNCAFKKSTLKKLGGFKTILGRVGQSRGAGEETELTERALLAGYKVLYDPYAHVKHLVTEQRLDIKYLASCSYGIGVSRASMPSVKDHIDTPYLYDILANLSRAQYKAAKSLESIAEQRKYYCLQQELLGHLTECLDTNFNHPIDEPPAAALQSPPISAHEIQQEIKRLRQEKKERPILSANNIQQLVSESPLKRFIERDYVRKDLSDLNIKAPVTIELLLLPDPSNQRAFEPYGPHTPPMPFLCEPFAIYQIEEDLMQIKIGPGGLFAETFECGKTWNHVVCTLDENGTAKAFIDGQLILTAELNKGISLSSLSLGKGYAERYWDGWVKSLTVSSKIDYISDFSPAAHITPNNDTLLFFNGTDFENGIQQ